MAAEYIQAGSGFNDQCSYFNIGTGAGVHELWALADVYLCPVNITTLPGQASGYYMSVYDLYGTGGQTYPYNISSGDLVGRQSVWQINAFNSPAYWESTYPSDHVTPVTVGLHTVGLHLKCTSPFAFDLYVDGHITTTTSNNGSSQFDAIAIGSINAGQWNQFSTNVKVGTGGFGSTDIFSDDYHTGTFAAWSGTFGGPTIVPSASAACQPPPPNIVFDGQQAFQIA